MIRDKYINSILLALRILPIISIIIIAILISCYWGEITVEEMLNYVPKSYFLAAITIIGMYMVKSLSVVFPLMALYISSGMIFSPLWGVLINLLGLFVCVSIPYWLGRFCGKGLLDRLIIKYKNVGKLQTIKSKHEWFISYILRMIGILPGDVVSMSLGAMGISYKKYVLGSIVGLLPRMIAATFLGTTITDPTSPIFIASCIMTILLSIGSFFVHQKFMKEDN
ncbi:TVP38/TMEM64 family protein [Oceanirhabdus seepicola]|uniref:TVP38/TMEM64 family membrane protein n=1 Tax=Oceanirhabdus seepicola TaxID=2828781 RepID=A0A9J6NYP4_9CLOT|nr:VTT domain-containing protein [Oceanirhabdus seepicola]MCM1989172.1 TVP38/TMEM64 family protein [Oceanirhabdus seepicola]